MLRQDALTIALVHGACVAGGCGLATAHDFVVAAEDAKFLYSEVRIGFVAALVATYLPLRLQGLGHPRAAAQSRSSWPPAGPWRSASSTAWFCRACRAAADLRTAGEALAAQILETGSSESIARTKRLLLDVIGQPLGEAMTLAAEVNAAARADGRLQARHRHLPGDQEAAEMAIDRR